MKKPRATWAIAQYVSAILALPASADFNFKEIVSFNSPGNVPRAADAAVEWEPAPYTLLSVPYTHVDLPPINANPTQIALNAIGSFFGISSPRSARAISRSTPGVKEKVEKSSPAAGLFPDNLPPCGGHHGAVHTACAPPSTRTSHGHPS